MLRTFSKLFGLAGARIGYAVARRDIADELNARQAPAPVSSLAADLAIAALASRPDPRPEIEERERLASALRALGLHPLESHTNFLYVPVEDGLALGDALLRQGLVVRAYPEAIRASVRDATDDDLLVEALARVLERPSPVAPRASRRATVRATAETRFATRLALDGASRVRVATGAGLYDHFLEQLAFHAGFDLILEGAGDLETGDHHTAEDAALSLGAALDEALGDRRGIARYGDAVVPMDDALARAAVDLGGRAHSELALEHDPGLATHMLASLAQAARASIQSRRPAATLTTSQRRRSRRSVARCARQCGSSRRGCRRRRASCEGRDLRVRRGERPERPTCVREARRVRDERRRRRRPRRAARCRLGACRHGRAARTRPRRGAAPRASTRAGRSSGSASVCSSRSTRPRRTAVSPGSGSSKGARSGCATDVFPDRLGARRRR